MEEALRRLVDEAAIREVHLRYCRGIDRMDWDLVRSCYHHDAIEDHGGYMGGIEGFIEWVKKPVSAFESTMHFAGNQLIEISGDVAWAERYTRAFHRVAATPDAPAIDLVANIRYIDRMERRGGEWRIAHRTIAVDSERADVVAKQPGFAQGLPPARRDRTDPSYWR